MIKLIACLLFIVQVIVYPAYSTSEDTKGGIESYDTLEIGGNTKINYAETSWDYTNEENQPLKITILDTSYSAVENIVGILGSDSSEASGACEGTCDSDSVGSVNYSLEDDDMLYAENIMLYLDLSFQFSDTYLYYGSASLDLIQIPSDNFYYTQAQVAAGSVDCESKRSTEFVFPLQTSSGEYVNADSTTYSGYAEVRLIIVEGEAPLLATCGISI